MVYEIVTKLLKSAFSECGRKVNERETVEFELYVILKSCRALKCYFPLIEDFVCKFRGGGF